MSIADNGYFDIAIDDDGFVLTSGEYEHPASPSVVQEHLARKVEVRVSESSQVAWKEQLERDSMGEFGIPDVETSGLLGPEDIRRLAQLVIDSTEKPED